jgi:hypothetical protein
MNLSNASLACSKLRSAKARISAGISKGAGLGMVGVLLILVATNTSPDVARAARHHPTPAIVLQTNTSSGAVRSGAAFAPSRRRDKARQSEFCTATIIELRACLLKD